MMKLIRKIKKHEVLRRWAIAEVYVEYLNSSHLDYPQETLRLLHSNDRTLEEIGINRSLKLHHLSLVDCLPADTSWFLAGLEINKTEFDQLYTLPVIGMAKISGDTYKVSQAAVIIQQNPNLDARITAIRNALKLNPEEVHVSGITLLAKDFDGPFTVIEGNGRLISLYSILFLEENNFVPNNQVEVAIGLSDSKFEIFYEYLD
jgi:hypothetical protein